MTHVSVYSDAPATDEEAYEALARQWNTHMMREGKCTAEHYTSTEKDCVVMLGNKALADEQRKIDGDLVSRICGR